MFQDDDSKYITGPASPDSHLDALLDFAKRNSLTVGSTTSGTHNQGSKHYSGNAFDIRNSGGWSDAQVAALSEVARLNGFKVRDERTRPPNQEVWGGPHVHVEVVGDPLSDDARYFTVGTLQSDRPKSAGGFRLNASASQPQATDRPKGAGGFRVDLPPVPVSLADIKRAEEQPVDPHQEFYAQTQNQKAQRAAIRRQVEKERMTNAPTAARLFAKGARMFGPLGTPVVDVYKEATTSEEDLVNAEVNKRITEQIRTSQPDIVAGRKELGRMSAAERAIGSPALRVVSGVLKSAAYANPALLGLEKLTGRSITKYLDKKGQYLEDVAAQPLDAAGEPTKRGLIEKGATAGVDLTFQLVQLATVQKATGMPLSRIMAIEAALKTRDPVEVSKAYAFGKILDGHLSRTASAAVFGAPAATEGAINIAQGREDVSDAILNTAIQAGTGFVFGGKPKTRAGIPRIDLMPEIPDVPVSTISEPRVIKGGGKDYARKEQPIYTKAGSTSEARSAVDETVTPVDVGQESEGGRVRDSQQEQKVEVVPSTQPPVTAEPSQPEGAQVPSPASQLEPPRVVADGRKFKVIQPTRSGQAEYGGFKTEAEANRFIDGLQSENERVAAARNVTPATPTETPSPAPREAPQGVTEAAAQPAAMAERRLPQTLEAAQLERGENLLYTPDKIAEGAESGRQRVKDLGVDASMQYVLHGEPEIDWAATGFATMAELRAREAQARAANDIETEAAIATKRRNFVSDFSERATKLGQAIVGIRAIEEFAPDRAAYIANRLSQKGRGKGLSPAEDMRINQLTEQLKSAMERNRALELQFQEMQKGRRVVAPKTDFQLKLEEQSAAIREILKPRLGKFDLGGLPIGKPVPVKQRGAVQIGEPPLHGDAELLAQYAAGRLGKLNTIAELNSELLREFGPEIESFLPQIRQRAYTIRQEARIAELESRDVSKDRRRTILQDLQQEIRDTRKQAKAYDDAAAQQARKERQALNQAVTAQARAELSVAIKGAREGRFEEARIQRERLAQTRREYREASKAEIKGYRESIKAQREAARTAGLWDTPIRNAATDARTRLNSGSTDMADLVDVAAEKLLSEKAGRARSIRPAQLYADLKTEFPELVTRKNQGQIYKEAYQRVHDATNAAREAARLRSADVEVRRLWEQEGIDIDTQAVLVQRAAARRQQLEARGAMAKEFNRVSRSRLSRFAFEIQAIPRALQSSVDAPLGRQGLFYMITHPVESFKTAVPATWHGYTSWKPETYAQRVAELEQHPDYQLARDAGVDLPELAGTTDPRVNAEESFQSTWAEKLPHVRLSEQGFTLGMNAQRVNMFSRYARLGRAEGYTFESNPEFFKQAAALVNDATGRGNMPDAIKRMSSLSNSLFYSTRLNISRVQLLNDLFNPVKYAKYDPVMRRIAIGEVVRLAAGMAVIYGTARMLGLGVTMNPDNPDFGKIRWGKTHYDVTGGEASTVRFLYRFLRGVAGLASGVKLEGQSFPASRYDPFTLAKNFARQKLAPWPSAAIDYLYGENVVGQPANLKVDVNKPAKTMQENIAVRMLIPMIVGDFVDGIAEDGWLGAAKVTPGLGGLGMQTYKPRSAPPPLRLEKAIIRRMHRKLGTQISSPAP